MKRWRGVLLGAGFLALAVLPGQSCGPFFPDTVFVLHQPESREVLMGGDPGIIWLDFGVRDLALAYRVLQGPAFTATEIESEKAQGATQDSRENGPANSAKDGVGQWLAARKAFTGSDGGPISTDAVVPGQEWQSYGNCLDDAFTSAAKTLLNREQEYGGARPTVSDWVSGQDAVFSNCSESGKSPSETAPSSPDWLRMDRAYQIAAAHF
jgi:hypothetical protein